MKIPIECVESFFRANCVRQNVAIPMERVGPFCRANCVRQNVAIPMERVGTVKGRDRLRTPRLVLLTSTDMMYLWPGKKLSGPLFTHVHDVFVM